MNTNYAKTRVLMIDDDTKLCRLVTDYLSPFGYEVESSHTGLEGVARARQQNFQAIILDVMLPEMDGFEVLKQIRKVSSIPVLMLTALGDESDRIVGLEMGADDYLPKTFSTRELLARLRAVTRRSTMNVNSITPEATEEIRINELSINPQSRKVKLAEMPIHLTALEFDLLICLARAADRVLTREQLLDEISGRDYEVYDRSIDVHISLLRRKLGDDPKNPKFIKTIRSVGYVLIRHAEDQRL